MIMIMMMMIFDISDNADNSELLTMASQQEFFSHIAHI